MRRFVARLFLLLSLSCPLPLAAQEEGGGEVDSSLVISLLTCSPGQEIYELYGHTALRVRSERAHWDVIFNYGAFDFTAPHFAWRFVLGQTDYMLIPEPLALFLKQYADRGSEVVEQELNLKPQEATRLAKALIEQSRPENRSYRYNIFRSNCTTLARDKIESCIDGKVMYPVHARRKSFRKILHEYTENHLWVRAGSDMLLGADVDTLITEREEMFAPLYMMHYADSAMIDAGRRNFRPLVSERRILLTADEGRQKAAADKQFTMPVSPGTLGWIILVAGLLLAAFELKRRRICWPVDAVFMALFSAHPGVSSNWLVWIFNPLPLFFLPAVVRADIHRRNCLYHLGATFFLVSFLALYFLLPQNFCSLTLPLALLLLSRSVVHLLIYKRS